MALPKNILTESLLSCKKAFYYVFLFSFATNILMMALPIYSLQVMDRVLSTARTETLLMLSVFVIGAFIAYGLIQVARSMTLIRISEWLDAKLAPIFLQQAVSLSSLSNNVFGSQSLRDLTNVRQFFTGAAINALFDAPWAMLYIIVLYFMHPIAGMIATFGGIFLLLLAILNEYATKQPLNDANEFSVKGLAQVDIAARNAEAVEAMGMMRGVMQRWQIINNQAIEHQALASHRATIISTFSKFFRLIIQVIVMGVGTYLTLINQLSVGGIIAGSILVGKALAPFETAIETWKQVVLARKSYSRLTKMIEASPRRTETISLPKPQGAIQVEKLVFAPPGSQRPTIKGISFELDPGDILGIIGPSAAGKSTLAKLMVGVWKPSSGVVRLDGADVFTWNRQEFGDHVGYLPQDVELFNGNIKENIARMEMEPKDETIITAAQLASVHDLILHLPDGYETQIGNSGSNLSAGQRQRVGLARAFYGDPKFLVLDEPNANLDEQGERALLVALHNAKARAITTVVISHRPSLLQGVDKVLVLNEGMIAAFGPRDEILQKVMKPVVPTTPIKRNPDNATTTN